MEMWEKSRPDPSILPNSPILNRQQLENKGATAAAVSIMSDSKMNLSPDFKKKYEQWQKMKNPETLQAPTSTG